MLLELQRRFHDAITSINASVPDDDVTSPQADIANRIDVYRTTVQSSLTDALTTAFPVIRRIVGPRFFAHLAQAYIAAAPPRVPHLSAYGNTFAAFIADFGPARTSPYLADVARLERSRAEAYFAPDALPLEPTTLARITDDDVDDLRLHLHPATRLVRSAFPIARIWHVNQPQNADVPALDMSVAENVLVTRPRHGVIARQISAGDAAFVAAVGRGATLGAAPAVALASEPTFDLQVALRAHLINGTFINGTDACFDQPRTSNPVPESNP